MDKERLVRQMIEIKIKQIEAELDCERMFKLNISQNMNNLKIKIIADVELEEYRFENYFNEEDSIEEVKNLLDFISEWMFSVKKISEFL